MSLSASQPAPTARWVEPATPGRLGAGGLCLLWVLFVIYGSLVPLDFKSVSFADAWSQLANAPMYQIGVAGRADWVANGVLYFPVGFLAAVWLLGGAAASATRVALAAIAAFGLASVLALAVEFGQVYFPPRTVSRNDLIAESLGALFGVLLALLIARRFRALLNGFAVGGQRLLASLGPAYAMAFAAWSMFPFDVLVSADEWPHRLSSAMLTTWLVSGDGQSTISALAKLAAETLAVAPLGLWWAARRASSACAPAPRLGHAFLWGALLGLVVEIAQLSIASGVSQAVSVMTRGVGFAAGAAIWKFNAKLNVTAMRQWIRRATLPVGLLYLPILTLHFGWWRGARLGLDDAF